MAVEQSSFTKVLQELAAIREDQRIMYDVMIGEEGKTKSGDPSLVTKVNEMYPILVSVRSAKYSIVTLATVGAAYIWLKTHWPF